MNLLSFHTVFILNENIKWLDEFIQYYLTIGFDHFYLYDNEGSIGLPNEGDEYTNKYGIPRSRVASDRDREELSVILDKYQGYITYVKWQPKDSNGNVVYGYNDSVLDFVKRFGHETEWVACMDLDEYLFSSSNIDIRSYFKNLDPNISSIKVSQKKFKDRFLSDKSKILEEFNCFDINFGHWWGAKNIFRPSHITNIYDMHDMAFKYTIEQAEYTLLQFNHYNVNDRQISWMNENVYNCGTFSFERMTIDDGMKRYLKTD